MEKNMKSFINDFRSVLKENNPLTIVMGNEAADLDSMASALSYAWYLKINNSDETPCPLINIPRADFKLRTEAVYLFEEAGVDVDKLIFIDDLNLQDLKDKGLLKLILVDHNKLGSSQSGLEPNVTAILDHHADEESYPKMAMTDIRPVGSCATIVAQAFLKTSPKALDKSLGTLLLGTILLDTVNLDPDAGRVTEDDSSAAAQLIKVCALDQKVLFDKLQFEKFNVASLGSYDLLRKDYKEWELGPVKCGIGAVLQPIEKWAEKDPDLGMACEAYVKERDLQVLFAMNAFTNPGFTREMVVCIPDTALRNKALTWLEASDLGLERLNITASGSCCVYFKQANLGISRKKLQPLLKEFFKG